MFHFNHEKIMTQCSAHIGGMILFYFIFKYLLRKIKSGLNLWRIVSLVLKIICEKGEVQNKPWLDEI